MTDCKDCRRLEHELELTRHALTLCESALAASQAKVDRLRSQMSRLSRLTGVSDVLDTKQFAERAGAQPMTVWQWHHRYPDFPKPVPGMDPCLYDRTDVDAFLERHPRLGNKKRAGS